MDLHVDTVGAAMPAKEGIAKVTVAKWGNSLAVRLPSESAKVLGFKEGDVLVAQPSPDGSLVLMRERRPVSKAEIRQLRENLEKQKMTTPVVERMRQRYRY